MSFIEIDTDWTMGPIGWALSRRALGELVTLWCYTSRYRPLPVLPDACWRSMTTPSTRRQLLAHGLVSTTAGGVVLEGQGTWWRLSRDTSRPRIPDDLRAAVYERDGHACVLCGVSQPLSLDHIWPWSLGGEDTFENLQTLCIPCNSRKGARV